MVDQLAITKDPLTDFDLRFIVQLQLFTLLNLRTLLICSSKLTWMVLSLPNVQPKCCLNLILLIVLPLKMFPSVRVELEHSNILHSSGRIWLLSSIALVNLCMFPLNFIVRLVSIFFAYSCSWFGPYSFLVLEFRGIL